jgi:hypothetical protein
VYRDPKRAGQDALTWNLRRKFVLFLSGSAAVVFVKGGLVHIDRSNAERIMATLGLTLSLLLVLAIVALAFS